MEGVAAQRYAASLFEVGVEENCLDTLWEELSALNDIFCQNPEFLKLLAAPILAHEEKARIIGSTFEGKVSVYALNFVRILADKGRIAQFSQVVAAFQKLYNKHNNIQDVTAVTAVPLKPELALKLQKRLEELTGKRIVLQNQVDPAILGGVVLKLDNDLIDDSVRARLEGLKKQLSATIA
jgi:F-type H+-transporting ATPase subunit delta